MNKQRSFQCSEFPQAASLRKLGEPHPKEMITNLTAVGGIALWDINNVSSEVLIDTLLVYKKNNISTINSHGFYIWVFYEDTLKNKFYTRKIESENLYEIPSNTLISLRLNNEELKDTIDLKKTKTVIVSFIEKGDNGKILLSKKSSFVKFD